MEIIGGAAPPPGTATDDAVIDGSDASFQRDVLEASRETPVIVDFWAPWCGPCRTLGPALEAAVRASQGKVKLVKIDIDQNPAVAGQMGVQSIPAVFAFDKGQPVDGFMGAVPPSEIDAFVRRLSGDDEGAKEAEALVARAEQALAAGDAGGAAQDFANALRLDPENLAGIGGLARCYLAGGDRDSAEQLLNAVPPERANDPAIAGAKAALALTEQGGDADDASELAAAVEAAPGDHAKRFELAQAIAARGDFEGAVDHLLSIIEAKRDWNEGAARAELLKVFDAAGPASPATREGRRRLSTILFS